MDPRRHQLVAAWLKSSVWAKPSLMWVESPWVGWRMAIDLLLKRGLELQTVVEQDLAR